MADGTKIEWTDATVNFLNGCTILSRGCTNCYAMTLAGTRMRNHPSREGLTKPSKAGPVWTGEVRPHWPAIAQVLSWSRPRKLFWNAHGDLFHENVPDELIDVVYATAALTPQHVHQFLTKRSARMLAYYNGLDRDGGVGRVARFAKAMSLIWEMTRHSSCAPRRGVPMVPHPLPNVWMGVSAEDQPHWDERVGHLRQVNAAVRWVSAEPLLGPIVDDQDMVGIEWVVGGFESGRNSRPGHPDYVRPLRDQCGATDTAFLFKQWGDWLPEGQLDKDGFEWAPGTDGRVHWWKPEPPHGAQLDDGHCSIRVGKKQAGRRLDGRFHDGYPA